MGEFVAGGADGSGRFSRIGGNVAFQLGRAEVPDQALTSHHPEITRGLMGPDRFCGCALGLVVSREIKQDHVHVSVIVRVIIADGDFSGQKLISLQDGLINTIFVIVLLVVGERYRAVNVKLGTVLVLGILNEIVPHRADSPIDAVS